MINNGIFVVGDFLQMPVINSGQQMIRYSMADIKLQVSLKCQFIEENLRKHIISKFIDDSDFKMTPRQCSSDSSKKLIINENLFKNWHGSTKTAW